MPTEQQFKHPLAQLTHTTNIYEERAQNTRTTRHIEPNALATNYKYGRSI
jgi:hypothetical protein